MQLPSNSFQAESRASWRSWLHGNHQQAEGVWLVTFKKGSGGPHLSYDEAVEEALCFGWVDSLPRKLDETRTMLYFAPRKPSSNWSRLNKERVERLTQQGLMHAAGLAKVEAARADGSWNALDAVENLVVPPDLQTALQTFPPAEANFLAFPKSARRGILEWIGNAKTPKTRSARIEETARLAADNLRANQWPRQR